MNAPVNMFDFSSAYRQLQPMQRTFVDGYVTTVEALALRRSIRLLAALQVLGEQRVDGRIARMLDNPMVRAAIYERVKEISDSLELSQYRTVKELVGLAFSNIGDYMTVDPVTGEPEFNLSKCTKEQLANIKSIKIVEEPNKRRFEFTLHDKIAALNMLGKHQGLLEPDNEYHRRNNEKTIAAKALPADATKDNIADMYSRMINGNSN